MSVSADGVVSTEWSDVEGPPSRYNTCQLGYSIGEITDSGSEVLMLISNRQPRLAPDGGENPGQQDTMFLPATDQLADLLQEMANAIRERITEEVATDGQDD